GRGPTSSFERASELALEEHDLGAAVLTLTVLAVVGRDRLILALTAGLDSVLLDASLHQRGTNRVRACLREIAVELAGAARVGVTIDPNARRRALAQQLRNPVDRGNAGAEPD